MFRVPLVVFVGIVAGSGYKNPNFEAGRNTIVHLFEWKWLDIAEECENFLQHKGYGGVQISPPTENIIISNRPWWERYQPVSYKLITRSGDESDFRNMTKRCNDVGIRIYPDVVLNHMTAGDGVGTSKSIANASSMWYPSVPYGPSDFHAYCPLSDFNNDTIARNCQLVGLKDLDQGKLYVREKILEFMNHLIDLGVAGFRIDAARHMWPADLKYIYSHLKDLNPDYGFQKRSRPFIFQEVANMDKAYVPLGALVEFHYSRSISNVFRGNDKLKWLKNWGPEWNFLDGLDALAFVDNHDNQRDSSPALTHKDAKRYKMAVAFMLAHPYGTTRVMSSYFFDDFNHGPPAARPKFNDDGSCKNGWVCEHRWREIYNMVEFRNVVDGTEVTNWWSNDDQQIAFCRGNRGFIVFTNWGDVKNELQTCLAHGVYCDIISGRLKDGKCTGKSVRVAEDGRAFIQLGALEFNGALAIHVRSKIE